MFGRRKRGSDPAADGDRVDGFDTDADDGVDVAAGTEDPSATAAGHDGGGPFDVTEVDEDSLAGRLDLGSVVLTLPQGGQVQVEMAPNGAPQAVHVVVGPGRITISAYAAPKSAGQWREVAAMLAESLRGDAASVSVETGRWGREVFGRTDRMDLRFIGVDGPRWMLRCVVVGPTGALDVDSDLARIARAVLEQTVVRRGTDPHPVQTPLPVTLPKELVEQLVAAQQQAAQQQAAQDGGGKQGGQPGAAPNAAPPQRTPAPGAQNPGAQNPGAQNPGVQSPDDRNPGAGNAGPQAPTPPAAPPRRGGSGSAMQQLGF